MHSRDLITKLNNLPAGPGVYLFKDKDRKVIYIGKAKMISNRVRSYFRRPTQFDQKTAILKNYIHDLDVIVTDSEFEAMLLESTLIRDRQPLFNINLKDDKSFLHIKLTVGEAFPRAVLTRRILDDGARYFGPYLPASLARNTIKIINRHFLLRTCDIEIDGELERPCLEYYIERCLAPCVEGLCTEKQYAKSVEEVVHLLEGKNQKLLKSLNHKMVQASSKELYEAAAFYRDRMDMVRDLARQQKMIADHSQDADVFAYHQEGTRLALQLFNLRQGRIVGKREFFWEDLQFFTPSSFLRDAIQQYYLQSGFIPATVYLPSEIEDQDLIAATLTKQLNSRHGQKVRIKVPVRGEKRALVGLVEKNARITFNTRFRVLKKQSLALLEEMQEALDLPSLPKHIEAFDISNIQGAETVGSMVVCENGHMAKQHYRKFRIKTVEGAHDFAAIHETVLRRYQRLLLKGKQLPDLVIVDGGKGQLHFAYQALAKLGIEDISLASIAKRDELLFVMGQEEPLQLHKTSPVLRLIQEIRNEAHRFAVAYHRKRRRMRDFHSVLDDIPGIGPKRKKRLLRNFGSIAGIRKAPQDELVALVGPRLSETIKKQLAKG